MKIYANDNSVSFGTRVFATQEAINAIKKSPAKCRYKAKQHINDLKQNGVNDMLILTHTDEHCGEKIGDVIIADIYVPGKEEGEYYTNVQSYQSYMIDPHNYSNKNEYLSIKELYKLLVEDIPPYSQKTKNIEAYIENRYTEL